MTRGAVTNEIRQAGYKITQAELRLMPYFIDVCMNELKFNRGRCTPEEGDIIKSWMDEDSIRTEGGSPWQKIIFVDEDWWNVACDLVFKGYIKSRLPQEQYEID